MTKVKKDRLKIEFQTVFALVLKQHTYKCGRFFWVFFLLSHVENLFFKFVFTDFDSQYIFADWISTVECPAVHHVFTISNVGLV